MLCRRLRGGSAAAYAAIRAKVQRVGELLKPTHRVGQIRISTVRSSESGGPARPAIDASHDSSAAVAPGAESGLRLFV
jgi:hypothetical protein